MIKKLKFIFKNFWRKEEIEENKLEELFSKSSSIDNVDDVNMNSNIINNVHYNNDGKKEKGLKKLLKRIWIIIIWIFIILLLIFAYKWIRSFIKEKEKEQIKNMLIKINERGSNYLSEIEMNYVNLKMLLKWCIDDWNKYIKMIDEDMKKIENMNVSDFNLTEFSLNILDSEEMKKNKIKIIKEKCEKLLDVVNELDENTLNTKNIKENK